MRRLNLPSDRVDFEMRRTIRIELATVRDGLIAEFAQVVPPGTVIRQLAISREQLLSQGVRSGLAAAAESMTRVRLLRMFPAHAVG